MTAEASSYYALIGPLQNFSSKFTFWQRATDKFTKTKVKPDLEAIQHEQSREQSREQSHKHQ